VGEIFVISVDLIFSTRIVQTAAALGLSCKVMRGIAQLQDAITEGRPLVAFVDLEADADTALAAIAALKAREPETRVIAYFSHVRTEHGAAARAAGADEVLTRSAFVAKLPALLRPNT
jgi:DNA-binding NarL/FixJ family response regulator